MSPKLLSLASFPGLQSPNALGDRRPGNEARNLLQSIPRLPLCVGGVVLQELGKYRDYPLHTSHTFSCLPSAVVVAILCVIVISRLVAATVGYLSSQNAEKKGE